MSNIAVERPAHRQVKMTEGFWAGQLYKIHQVTVWDVLEKFEKDHEEGIMKNYEWVIEGKGGRHVGPPWYDGLICEVIRGISDIIAVNFDEKLDKKIEAYAEIIAAAQEKDPDGYINTYTTLICPGKRWGGNGGSLIWQHETYNIGCLTEAGIHYYRATGKKRLLSCTVKAVNGMCNVMVPDPGTPGYPGKNIVPAHSLAEEAVIKLYCLFREEPGLSGDMEQEYGICVQPERYYRLVKFWMDHRGVHHDRYSMPHYMGEYSQDHCRITEQSEVVGHAVRAALMYTGLTALGIETEEADNSYLRAAVRLWDNMEHTKLHISGGIGAVHNEERFGYQYDLPNDAYLETCAGAALAFWAGEMHRAFGDGKYMDVLECAVMNNVLPCLSQDGTRYFYENPLISDGETERWSWHGCPCCPPMFLKIMGCLQDYIYGFSKGRVYINLHMGSRYEGTMEGRDGSRLELAVEQTACGLPWKGTNRIVLHPQEKASFILAVRRPAWSGEMTVLVNGELADWPLESGYFLIEREWKDADVVQISMELPAVKVEAHPFVTADTGRVALQRGPLLYCLEETDNPLGTDVLLGEGELKITDSALFGGISIIEGETAEGGKFRALPYYLWNNRGKGKMNVWIRQQKAGEVREERKEEAAGFAAHGAGTGAGETDLTGWEGRLYRRYDRNITFVPPKA